MAQTDWNTAPASEVFTDSTTFDLELEAELLAQRAEIERLPYGCPEQVHRAYEWLCSYADDLTDDAHRAMMLKDVWYLANRRIWAERLDFEADAAKNRGGN